MSTVAVAQDNTIVGGDPGQIIWWKGVEPQVLVQACKIVGARKDREIGSLVAQPGGIEYTGETRVFIAWDTIAQIEVVEYRHAHGKQRSAFGFGDIGVAFVIGTAIANARNRRIDIDHIVKITTKDKKLGQFVVKGGADVKWGGLDQVIQRLNKFNELNEPKPVSNQISVVDELEKLDSLRQKGILTEQEFASQKARLLNGN